MRSTDFVLHMYNQSTSEQRSQIPALLQSGTSRKGIAKIAGISHSTLSRELNRNSCRNGRHYCWKKAHDMAMERSERICPNRMIAQPVMKKALISGSFLTNRYRRYSINQTVDHVRKSTFQLPLKEFYAIISQFCNCLLSVGPVLLPHGF